MSARQFAVAAVILVGSLLVGCSSTGDLGSRGGAADSVDTSASALTSPSDAPVTSPTPSPAPETGSNSAWADRPSSISGTWSPSDDSKVKMIGDNGECTSMYYNGTSPLDIGGPMSCTLSQRQANGYYLLVVRQPPNQSSYQVKFSDSDTMTLYTSGSVKIVTLTRQ